MLPWDVQRLSPVELEALQRGEQQRWNRTAMALAWAMSLIRPFVATAVNHGIAAAFDEKVSPLPPINLQELVRSIPGYREDDDE